MGIDYSAITPNSIFANSFLSSSLSIYLNIYMYVSLNFKKSELIYIYIYINNNAIVRALPTNISGPSYFPRER